MTEIVTARVPAEIRRQGNAVLKAMGATPTSLVNAAYEYVIACRELPKAQAGEVPAAQGRDSTKRRLSADQQRRLMDSLAASTLEVPASLWSSGDYKDILAQGRRADYEALS